MYSPTTRVLAVLDLLQSQGRLTGAELARRVNVDARTLRRYIARLEELGIPVRAERGRYGCYSLMPGFKLPPMMFSNAEAVALIDSWPRWPYASSQPLRLPTIASLTKPNGANTSPMLA